MADNSIGSGSTTPVSAPLGTEPVNQPAQQVDSTPAEPTIYDVDDDTLIRTRGSKDPVKFRDYNKGFQSQATRANQERARVQQELAKERELRQRYENERQNRAQEGTRGRQDDVYESLRQLPYLDGPTAVKVVQSIAGQIQQRDQIMLVLAQELQKVKQMAGGLHETHTQQSFEAKIDRFLSQGGYGPELKDLATETYLAYEPSPDLDQEFPRILAERIEQIQKWHTAQQRQKVDNARRQPFVPGRGGNGSPSKPVQLDPRASHREIADALWDSIQTGNTT